MSPSPANTSVVCLFSQKYTLKKTQKNHNNNHNECSMIRQCSGETDIYVIVREVNRVGSYNIALIIIVLRSRYITVSESLMLFNLNNKNNCNYNNYNNYNNNNKNNHNNNNNNNNTGIFIIYRKSDQKKIVLSA